MQYRTFHVGTIDFAADQKKTLGIGRDGVLVGLNLRLRFTNTNSGTPPVGPLFQTLARLIRRVDFVIGGRDTVLSQSGEMLTARAALEFGAVPDGMADTVDLIASTGTAYDVTIPIPRYLPRSNSPLMTADDLRRVNQAVLEITWGNNASLFKTPNTNVISLATCDVEAHYLLDVPAERGFNVRQLQQLTEEYTATNDNLGITIDNRTGLVLRSILVAMLDDDVGSNALLNNFKLQSGAFVRHQQRRCNPGRQQSAVRARKPDHRALLPAADSVRRYVAGDCGEPEHVAGRREGGP